MHHRLDKIRSILQRSIEAKRAFLGGPLEALLGAADAIALCFRAGGKLLIFGNGGSAADAQHLAAEFVNRFLRPRGALAALALTTDTSVLTSIANDDDFKEIFARQISALGRPGDVALGITTSGRSSNVLRGLEEARRGGLVTVGLTGWDGSLIKDLLDHWIPVESRETPRIQEVHITVGHILCELVEEQLTHQQGDAGL
jgi:D-sedoheptulose 7-phosphate isomerase